MDCNAMFVMHCKIVPIFLPVWLWSCPPGYPTGGVALWAALVSCLGLFDLSLSSTIALLGGKASPCQSAAGKPPLCIAIKCKTNPTFSFLICLEKSKQGWTDSNLELLDLLFDSAEVCPHSSHVAKFDDSVVQVVKHSLGMHERETVNIQLVWTNSFDSQVSIV